MPGLTDTWENRALDYVLGVNPSANRWLALYTVAPTDSTAGTEVPNSNNYSRQPVTFNAASGGATSNASTVTWPAATGSWGTIVAVGVVTSATHGGGELVVPVALTPNQAVANTNVFEILAGELDITAD